MLAMIVMALSVDVRRFVIAVNKLCGRCFDLEKLYVQRVKVSRISYTLASALWLMRGALNGFESRQLIAAG